MLVWKKIKTEGNLCVFEKTFLTNGERKVRNIYYRAFHRFGQAKFPNDGSVLGSSQFSILSQLHLKTMLGLKVVKIDSKISNSLCESKSVKSKSTHNPFFSRFMIYKFFSDSFALSQSFLKQFLFLLLLMLCTSFLLKKFIKTT